MTENTEDNQKPSLPESKKKSVTPLSMKTKSLSLNRSYWIVGANTFTEERLRPNARCMAVALVHYETELLSARVRREPGCTVDGYPVYTCDDFSEYIVGRTKKRPDNAVSIDDTDLWVSLVRYGLKSRRISEKL
jgi:hypothetical protein